MFKRILLISLLLSGVTLPFVFAFFFFKKSSPVIAVGQSFVVSSNEAVKNASKDVVSKTPITLLFGGDIMLDRYIRTSMKRLGSEAIFQGLSDTFRGVDMVVANLEGPITPQASLSERSVIGEAKNYIFTFDPSSATLLKEEHVGIVSLGNNHILNFGEGGVRETEKFLQEAGVEYFGSPLSGEDRVLLKNINGTIIAFVNYNQFIFQGKEKALEDIKSAREKAGVVVVYTHWGKEYVPALPETRELAHEFIEKGADLIIGSHPHVVEEKEIYQGKTIYYSLGNLIFDQYDKPETRTGLLVKAVLHPSTKNISFEEIPIVLKSNGQTVLREH